MNKPNFPVEVAIDPLALLLPEGIYVKIIDKINPNTPVIKAIEHAVSLMNAEDKAYTKSRIAQMKEYTEAIERALAK